MFISNLGQRRPMRITRSEDHKAQAPRPAIQVRSERRSKSGRMVDVFRWAGWHVHIIKTRFGLLMMTKKREGLFPSRPTIYICLILCSIIAASGYKLRTQTIFACQASLYNSDRYLAYCNGTHYGDYEHGAFWFDLEPSAQTFAQNADVLFLGNSRLQIAFSTAATADWFSAASARYYLLGFSGFENVIFAEELLRRIRPKAGVYVINVDDFFDRWVTPSAQAVMHDPDGRNRYEEKALWQRVHERVCTKLPAFCGDDLVFFRSRETGAYTTRVGKQKVTPVSYDQVISQDLVNSSTAAAIDFLPHLPVERRCVILTTVPYHGTKIGNVKAVATALGEHLIPPEIPMLQTFDGGHLDQPSAEHWSQAFFRAASSRIRSCLDERGAAYP